MCFWAGSFCLSLFHILKTFPKIVSHDGVLILGVCAVYNKNNSGLDYCNPGANLQFALLNSHFTLLTSQMHDFMYLFSNFLFF
jgi:hypothetical protein